MPIVWPATLPQMPELGWSEKKLKNKIRSETDTGPAKERRRFTRANRRIQLGMVFTADQVQIMDDFHTTTLADGVLRFDYVHPRSGITYSCRMLNELQFSEPANGMYRATLDLEFNV